MSRPLGPLSILAILAALTCWASPAAAQVRVPETWGRPVGVGLTHDSDGVIIKMILGRRF